MAEQIPSKEIEPISAIDYLYDMQSFKDRFLFHLSKINPKNYFLSRDKIDDALIEIRMFEERLLQMKKQGNEINISPAERKVMREYASILGTAVHPDTNQVQPIWLRFTNFIPVQLSLAAAKVFSPESMAAEFSLFLHFLNQLFFALLNIGNANASSNYKIIDAIMGFVKSLAASIAI